MVAESDRIMHVRSTDMTTADAEIGVLIDALSTPFPPEGPSGIVVANVHVHRLLVWLRQRAQLSPIAADLEKLDLSLQFRVEDRTRLQLVADIPATPLFDLMSQAGVGELLAR